MAATYSGSRPGLSRATRVPFAGTRSHPGRSRGRWFNNYLIDFAEQVIVGFVLAKIANWLVGQRLECPNCEFAARTRAALIAVEACGPPDRPGRVGCRKGLSENLGFRLPRPLDLDLRQRGPHGIEAILGIGPLAHHHSRERRDPQHRRTIDPARTAQAMAPPVARRARLAGGRSRPGAAPGVAAVGVDLAQAGHARHQAGGLPPFHMK